MKAIIYTSNAGSTVQYAQLLADELHLPVYSAKEAKKKVPAHSEIIYLGWIMAGGIKGYKDMVKKYNVPCSLCSRYEPDRDTDRRSPYKEFHTKEHPIVYITGQL